MTTVPKSTFPSQTVSNILDTPTYTLGQKYSAEYDRFYGTAFRMAEEAFRFGKVERDPNFNPDRYARKSNSYWYKYYAEEFDDVKNEEHFKFIENRIAANVRGRSIRAQATFWEALVPNLIDPVNAIPIGWIFKGAKGVAAAESLLTSSLSTGARVGLFSGGIETVRETIIHQGDVTANLEESAVNVLTTGILSGVIGGGAKALQLNAVNKALRGMTEVDDAIKLVEDWNIYVNKDMAITPRDQRPLGSLTDDQLQRSSQFGPSHVAAMEEISIRKAENLGIAFADPYNFASNALTDSLFFKAVTTPMKRILQGRIPSAFKEITVKTAGDFGLKLQMNMTKFATPDSVAQEVAVNRGKWLSAHDSFRSIWLDETKAADLAPLDVDIANWGRRIGRTGTDFQSWLDDVGKKIVANQPLNANEARVSAILNDFLKVEGDELIRLGMVSTKAGLDVRVNRMAQRILDLENKLAEADKLPMGTKRNELRTLIGAAIADLRGSYDYFKSLRDAPDTFSNAPNWSVSQARFPDADPNFFPRFWKFGEIERRRGEFSQIVKDWFVKHPYTTEFNARKGEWEVTPLSLGSALDDRVKEVVDDLILAGKEPVDVSNVYFGRSKHFRSRDLNIPNSLVADFIETNPLQVMNAYQVRVDPRAAYIRKFGKEIDDMRVDMEIVSANENISLEKFNEFWRDYRHLYDSVAGVMIQHPDAMSMKMAQFLRDGATFAWGGSFGLSSIPDAGRIVAANDLDTIVRAVKTMADKSMVGKAAKKELRLSASIMEVVNGSAYTRFVEDMGNSLFNSGKLNTMRDAFHTLNLLNPLTALYKQIGGLAEVHSIIERSLKFADGTISDQDRVWLLGYGISENDARLIATQPFQRNKDGLYIGNTENWTDPDLVRRFRIALNSGLSNTIMHATAADKPILMSGVYYVPYRIGRRFGMKESLTVPGYSRIEYAPLALPFTFMTFSFANLNKTVGAFAQGQVRNRALAVSTMLGLSYMTLKLKMSSRAWESMEFQDKVARSIDQSGIAALYTDMFYTGMQTNLALGGPNITGGIINPKFPQDESITDAFLGFAGAGPSWAFNLGEGIANALSGEVGKGGAQVMRSMPGNNLWFWRQDMSAIARGFSKY